jgi:Fe-S oxidoreductase
VVQDDLKPAFARHGLMFGPDTSTSNRATISGMIGNNSAGEHYELSLQVGEDRLFPAVRAASQDAVIAATGVSCGQQIHHGPQRTAQHPVELVLSALAEPSA